MTKPLALIIVVLLTACAEARVRSQNGAAMPAPWGYQVNCAANPAHDECGGTAQ